MRRRVVLALIPTAVLLLAPGRPAGAQGSFTFFGSGWGHGLGMSQYGAYGLALEGWTHEEILTHFYSGTAVGEAPSSPKKLRIGLVQGEGRIHLTATGGPVQLRVGSPRGALAGTIPPEETWHVEPREGRYRIVDAAGEVVGGQLWGSPTEHLFVRYAPAGSIVHVREAGHRYNRGYIQFNLYRGGAGKDRLRLIAVLRPQHYLYGLAEVPSGWPEAALKAQAVAARTYAFEKATRLGQHRAGCNCALFASTLDQVYAGWDKEGGLLGDRWVQAVDQTDGQVVLYRGAYIQAFYHSSSGGHTENNENVWGGTPIEYLRGVCDPGDYTPANPNRVWQVTLEKATAGTLLARETGQDIGELRRFEDTVRGVSGRIITTVAMGTAGQLTISGSTFQRAFGLNDDLAWIDADFTITDPIRTKYDRLMCAPGLPTSEQVELPGGLRQSFEDGALYRNTARQVTRWLRGPIHEKYVALGESASVLGMPRSSVRNLPALSGSRARFEGGFIYFKEGLGAFALYGPVLDYYRSVGGASGHLGFPTSDVAVAPDGSSSATFEGGAVSCKPNGSCREA